MSERPSTTPTGDFVPDRIITNNTGGAWMVWVAPTNDPTTDIAKFEPINDEAENDPLDGLISYMRDVGVDNE